MDMNTLFNSIHSAGQALRAELVSAQLAADSSTLTTITTLKRAFDSWHINVSAACSAI